MECVESILKGAGRLLTLWATIALASHGLAMEKHWPAHEAELIVIGTLHPHPTYPWFDGFASAPACGRRLHR